MTSLELADIPKLRSGKVREVFDLGDTLWHFPNMPPRELVRKETVRRIRELLASWGHDFEGERFYLGRDIRLAVEEETSRAFHGDCVDPNYPELCRRVAARHSLWHERLQVLGQDARVEQTVAHEVNEIGELLVGELDLLL